MLLEDDKGAYISPSGYYRYWLMRSWNEGEKKLAFVMLNPSTADAYEDDPTIRRCIGFAKRENAGGIVVVNLFAGRATQPSDLFKMHDPAGPLNAKQWRVMLADRKKIICAWGAEPRAADQAKRFRAWAADMSLALWCLGKTKDGHPRHPLYLKSDAPLVPYG